MLVDDPAQAKDLLEVLLQCLAHPELEIAQMSFNFFYRAAQFIAVRFFFPNSTTTQK